MISHQTGGQPAEPPELELQQSQSERLVRIMSIDETL